MTPGVKSCPSCQRSCPDAATSCECGYDFATTTRLTSTPSSTDRPTRIGRYRILETLGEGGMGVVYLAEQDHPIRRRVAVKVIKLGMDTNDVIRRFDSERQALALMNHPNIAQVLDAGVTETGSPYFVMEYIAGLRISDYCDRHRLTTHERLELFRPVCQAVQHAHQKGIIHRDLKPNNVLVTLVDGKPAPKVIDFGVAKAMNQRLTEQTVFTQHGLAIGTPEYMSPEQAEMTGLDVDTTTDIYSLGVMLYELLVGTLPLDSALLRHAGYEEMRRIIREQEPPTLTGKLGVLGNTAKQIAHNRRTDPQSLRKQLQGDLDWITLKAMDKDRARRYQSASEFVSDIHRHLKREPVLAGPPSTVYRFRKFVSRHRTPVVASAFVLAALILGIVGTTSMYVVARSERQEARWQSYVSSIRAANLAARNEDVAELRGSLEACPPEYRGWEWNHLNYVLQGNRRKLDPGDWPWLTRAFFDRGSPRIFAVSSFTNRIHVWNAQNLSSERTIDLLSDGTREPQQRLLAVSHDGSRAVVQNPSAEPFQSFPFLVGLGQDSGQRSRLGSSKGVAYFASFSDDGSLVAIALGLAGSWGPVLIAPSSRSDMVVEVFETQSATRVASFATRHASIHSIGFDPRGRLLAIASEPDELLLLDVKTGRAVRLDGRGRGPLAFSPDGRRLAASGDGGIRVFDVDSRKLLRAWLAGDVASMTFTPEGTGLLSSARNTLRLWDVRSASTISTWLTDEPVTYLSFAPDGAHFISTSTTAAHVWDTSSTSFGRVLSVGDGFVSFAGPRRDGTLSVALRDSTLVRIDMTSGTHTAAVRPTKKPPEVRHFFGSDIHPAGTHLVHSQVSPVGSIQIVPSRNAAGDETIKLGDQEIWSLKFSGNGGLLAVVFRVVQNPPFEGDKFVRIYEWPSLKKQYEAKLPDTARPDDLLKFGPDSKLLVVGNEILLWNQTKPGRIALTAARESLHNVAFSADGRRLAGIVSVQPQRKEGDWRSREGSDDFFMIWDTSAKPRIVLKRQVEWFGNLTFSSDGSRIFTYSEGGIRIWDASTLTPLISLESRAGAEYYRDLLSFDALRQALVASTSGGEILIFRTRDGG